MEFLKNNLEKEEEIFLEIKKKLEDGYIDDAIKIQEAFPISEEKLEEASFLVIKKELEGGWIDVAIKIQESFPVSEEMLNSEELQEASFLVIKKELEGGYLNDAIKIQEAFPVSQEKLEEASFLAIKEKLESGYVNSAIKIQEAFPISEEMINSEELQEASFLEIKKRLEDGYINGVTRIQEAFPITQEKLEEASFLGIRKRLEDGCINGVIEIQEAFPISEEMINSEALQEASFLGIKKNLEYGYIDDAIKIQEAFSISQEKLEEVSFLEIKKNLEDGYIDSAIKIQEYFPVSQEKLEEVSFLVIKKNLEDGYINGVIKIQEAFPISKEKLEEASFLVIKKELEGGYLNDAIKIQEAFPLSEEYLVKEILNGFMAKIIDIEKENFEAIFGEMITEDNLNPNLTYAENIHNHIIRENEFSNVENPEELKSEKENLPEEEKAKNIFENLSKLKNSVWDVQGDRSDIAKEFLLGAEKFGYKKMFDFIQYHNRHDALFAFDKIIKLQEKSGLESDDFYGKILFQVAKDNSEDENERDSYAKLNDIAQKFAEKNINVLAEEVEKLDILSANKLLEDIKNEDGEYNFFQNWKILQKIADFETILAKKDVLEKIKNSPEKHQKFYEKLIFHPNIDTSAVIQMIEDPEGFLNREDVHSGELHRLSMSGNFYKFDYSNLSAREVVDMLIDGKLDKIQKIPIFEMEFKIPVEEHLKDLTVRQLLRKAIGVRGKNAEAKRPKKIFKDVNDLIKKYNQENEGEGEIKFDKDFIDDENISIPEKLEEDIQKILFNEENGFESKIIRFASLAKSDPDGIIAGTDTASCDALGSGKKNTYIFNPNIGSIVIQEKRGDDWKTLSQATVTLNYEIDKSISTVKNEIQNNNGNISEILNEDILKKQKKVLSLDSIEGQTNNFLKSIWKNGVFALTKEMVENENIDTSRFIQGSYQGLVLDGRNVENNFISTTIMGYSDNVKNNTNEIFEKRRNIYGEITKEVVKKEKRDDLPGGISELDSGEVLKVAYLEGKAYSDTEGLQEFLFKISNTLIGQDYESIKSPKMSFKYENSDGKMEGYLVAYEANFDDEEIEKIPALYINDLAALSESKMAGGKLINTFVSEYMENYIDKGEMIPIVTHARDKTSYKIITKQLDKIGKRNNIKFEMKEINNYEEGEDVMHTLVIYPKKIEK